MYIYTGYGIAYDRLSSYRPPALKIRAISSRGSGRGQQGRTIWSRYDRAVRARANEGNAFWSRPTQHKSQTSRRNEIFKRQSDDMYITKLVLARQSITIPTESVLAHDHFRIFDQHSWCKGTLEYLFRDICISHLAKRIPYVRIEVRRQTLDKRGSGKSNDYYF